MKNELSAPQYRILAEVQREGKKIYSSRQLAALQVLVRRGLVQVGVNPLYDNKRGRGFKSYTAYAIGEEMGNHWEELDREGNLVPGKSQPTE